MKNIWVIDAFLNFNIKKADEERSRKSIQTTRRQNDHPVRVLLCRQR